MDLKCDIIIKRGVFMRDFPVFDTQYGVASLTLREIPYCQKAYIKILDTLEPEKLLSECRGFCTAVGAEQIYASGHEILEQYSLHATIVRMECNREQLLFGEAAAVAVTEETADLWKKIYNEKMKSVPNAAYMDDAQAKKLPGSGCYIYKEDRLIGIGKLGEGTIEAVASLQPGAGAEVVSALAKRLDTQKVTLEVAAENTRAVVLYERLGFIVTGEISKWYQIL